MGMHTIHPAPSARVWINWWFTTSRRAAIDSTLLGSVGVTKTTSPLLLRLGFP